jgi:hypothetical protein
MSFRTVVAGWTFHAMTLTVPDVLAPLNRRDGTETRVEARENHSKTNHERTLSVPYVFRNHLIWSE